MGYSVRPRLLTSRCSKCFLAEKGGSRTLRGPYGSQTGFEDQRHHRAPSFSLIESSFCVLTAERAALCLPFLYSISIVGPSPNAGPHPLFEDQPGACASVPKCARLLSWNINDFKPWQPDETYLRVADQSYKFLWRTWHWELESGGALGLE
jgi:hypothetical protein